MSVTGSVHRSLPLPVCVLSLHVLFNSDGEKDHDQLWPMLPYSTAGFLSEALGPRQNKTIERLLRLFWTPIHERAVGSFDAEGSCLQRGGPRTAVDISPLMHDENYGTCLPLQSLRALVMPFVRTPTHARSNGFFTSRLECMGARTYTVLV